MGVTEKIERQVVSTSIEEKSKATFKGWALDFTVKRNTERVMSINVSGNNGTGNVSASLSETGYINIGFSFDVRDPELVQLLTDVLIAIKTGAITG